MKMATHYVATHLTYTSVHTLKDIIALINKRHFETHAKHNQGRLNQWAHWARAQGPRIFSFSGAPTSCGEIIFLN